MIARERTSAIDKFADASIRRAFARNSKLASISRTDWQQTTPSSPMISSKKNFFQDLIAAKAKGSSDNGFFAKLEKVRKAHYRFGTNNKGLGDSVMTHYKELCINHKT